ncbi:ABC transporter ATP-binding protein [Desulfuribacillus alkaliarsenatis]|uniref:ABC transporter ATP-binding protein n=1 Tax=Desulfuribacillus alkaliarsenatis TaxID=766136 RepID=A0A1E5G5L1_9FIRM|nr:ABC transporter ATP-binding protein [Desulfuribacillus alkaliarsenatis]OEF97979.1 ABC transporter ATP-binding protein [Desulfuribacillus alkaliarsenatis]
MDNIFSLKGVKFKSILDIESMEIPAAKVTCIIGESGSGKSTLLKLLNQIISADQGRILFKGKSIEDIDTIALRRQVVMLQQSPVIYKGTVRENLLIGLQFSELQIPNEELLLQALRDVNVKKQLDEDAANLSGGEKQRVAIARVMLMDPEVYLLDEPSSALDEGTEEFIIGCLVNKVKQRGKTLVMVTHSKKLTSSFAEHIIEVKKRGGD